MKKKRLQHSTLKLNKGRIADLQAGTIFGGEDKGGKNKDTVKDCIHSNSIDPINCPEPINTNPTY